MHLFSLTIDRNSHTMIILVPMEHRDWYMYVHTEKRFFMVKVLSRSTLLYAPTFDCSLLSLLKHLMVECRLATASAKRADSVGAK